MKSWWSFVDCTRGRLICSARHVWYWRTGMNSFFTSPDGFLHGWRNPFVGTLISRLFILTDSCGHGSWIHMSKFAWIKLVQRASNRYQKHVPLSHSAPFPLQWFAFSAKWIVHVCFFQTAVLAKTTEKCSFVVSCCSKRSKHHTRFNSSADAGTSAAGSGNKLTSVSGDVAKRNVSPVPEAEHFALFCERGWEDDQIHLTWLTTIPALNSGPGSSRHLSRRVRWVFGCCASITLLCLQMYFPFKPRRQWKGLHSFYTKQPWNGSHQSSHQQPLFKTTRVEVWERVKTADWGLDLNLKASFSKGNCPHGHTRFCVLVAFPARHTGESKETAFARRTQLVSVSASFWSVPSEECSICSHPTQDSQ